jgi:hypothetical protein
MGDHNSEVTAKIEDIANGINALNISGRRSGTRPHKSLNDTLHSFDEAAAALTEQAATVVKLLSTDGTLNKRDTESICLVQTRGLQLARLAQLLIDSAIPALVRQVISLGAQISFPVDELLEHFKKSIENITQRVIRTSGSEDILRKIADECYHQAASPTGELNPGDYFATSKWAGSTDEGENWNKFWTRALCNCPGGPTLFQPNEDSVTKPPTQSPPYLFRAWDVNSTGVNAEDVIASILSKDDKANRHKVDIFSMDYQQASEMLHDHLSKGTFTSLGTDNFVSWSSSLMFVIQYANWRLCNTWYNPQNDTRICIVDMKRFPQGQFARDMWLLKSFRHANFKPKEMRIRNLRLIWTGFDNGEYLSQGKLQLEGRSYTFSVLALKNAGLWDLYPEFNIVNAEPTDPVKKDWTNYIKDLRQKWLAIRKTTKAEVQCALKIAEKCFPGFDTDDMALLLLSFRERKLHPESPSFQNPFADLLSPVSAEGLVYEEPVEVERYSKLRERLSKLSEASGERGMKLFEQLYVLEDADED